MDIIVLFNGLGNQMSQFAFYLNKKSINSNTEYIIFNNDHNGFELNNVFNLNLYHNLKRQILYFLFRVLLTKKIIFFPFKFLIELFNVKIIRENFEYNFNGKYIETNRGINFYFGGWHSEYYFGDQIECIKKKFQFNLNTLDEINNNHLFNIRNQNSVSLHIRRGDYINSNNLKIFGKVCTIEYYLNAINKIEKLVQNPTFYIFSNDVTWVKQNLHRPNMVYISNNKKINSWIDLLLMTECKHHIIANSSFSWWGSWLSKTNGHTICPVKFTLNEVSNDVYLANWIKIST